jgi:hypothetical protein
MVTVGENPVEGAIASLAGYRTDTTDSEGIASFSNVLPEFDISFTVSAIGFDDVAGVISVTDFDVNERVEISQTIYAVLFILTDGLSPLAGAEVAQHGQWL